jgi:ATP-dependent Lon protease
MEQYRHIRKELGLNKDEKNELAKKYIERLKRKIVPKEVMVVLKEQADKLQNMEASSPEYGMVHMLNHSREM